MKAHLAHSEELAYLSESDLNIPEQWGTDSISDQTNVAAPLVKQKEGPVVKPLVRLFEKGALRQIVDSLE